MKRESWKKRFFWLLVKLAPISYALSKITSAIVATIRKITLNIQDAVLKAPMSLVAQPIFEFHLCQFLPSEAGKQVKQANILDNTQNFKNMTCSQSINKSFSFIILKQDTIFLLQNHKKPAIGTH